MTRAGTKVQLQVRAGELARWQGPGPTSASLCPCGKVPRNAKDFGLHAIINRT